MASGYTRRSLDWISGHPGKCSEVCESGLRTWFSGQDGSVSLMVGHGDLRDLFQP